MLHFSNNDIQCSVCSNRIEFSSFRTNIKVCPTCNSVIERNEAGFATTLSISSVKQQVNNIITIGTRGKYNSKAFEIIGCLRCDMGRFYNNRWTIRFDDGNIALLTESLGFYAIQQTTNIENAAKLQLVSALDTGTDSIEINRGSKMYVFEKYKCEKSWIEGEVFLPKANTYFKGYELADNKSNRLEIIDHGNNLFEVFTVDYLLLQELSLINTAKTKVEAVTLKCGKCSKPLTIKFPQYNTHVVCPGCYTWNEREGTSILKERKKFGELTSDLPLGSKGIINGIHYEIIGITKKYESGSINTHWMEYTLFNEETGFAFLAEYNGHWTYLKEIKLGHSWPQYNQEIMVDGENYVLFNDYTFKIKSACGEFFTPLNGGNIKAKEYISPPEMYAAENNDSKEITWYRAMHISVEEVYKGLNINKPIPYAFGIGPLQPMKLPINMRLLKRMSLIALGALFAVQAIFSFSAKDTVVFTENILLPDSIPSKGIVTNSFLLTPKSSNLEFYINAPVSDSWFEADITMVNDQTGKEFNINKGVEYYSGYSDGEHWTEGSTNVDAMLSSVPRGNYHLNIFPSTGGNSKVNSFTITVKNDVPMWRNFLFIALFASFFPLLQWGRTHMFERRRWNNSPNNTYQTEE